MAKDQSSARPPVKTSVPLDVRTHAKLCAAAALRGVDRSTLAASFIRDGLKDVVVMDSRRKSGSTGDDDRQGLEAEISLEGEDSHGEGPGLTVAPNTRAATSKRAAG